MVIINEDLRVNQNTPKTYPRAKEIREKLLDSIPIDFLSKIDGLKIQECKQQEDESISNYRYHLENIWKDYSGLTLDEYMASALLTGFVN